MFKGRVIIIIKAFLKCSKKIVIMISIIAFFFMSVWIKLLMFFLINLFLLYMLVIFILGLFVCKVVIFFLMVLSIL